MTITDAPLFNRAFNTRPTNAVSTNKFVSPCSLCVEVVEIGEGYVYRIEDAWSVQHIDCESVASKRIENDHSKIEGYYAIAEFNDTVKRAYQIKVQSDQSDFMPGTPIIYRVEGLPSASASVGHLVENGSGYAVKIWKRFIEFADREDMENITKDFSKAGWKYADATGRCYICNKKLTVEASIHKGLGPDCAKKAR